MSTLQYVLLAVVVLVVLIVLYEMFGKKNGGQGDFCFDDSACGPGLKCDKYKCAYWTGGRGSY